MTVRLVAGDYPACQAVFRRHGEPDRAVAKFGHLEPIERFASRRGIDLDALLDELSTAAGVPVEHEDPAARQAHRPFIAAALLLTLSLGAGWGGLLLAWIGWRGTFEEASPAQIVAHGEAQLWGFVALFVMGVAVGYLPITTARPRPTRGRVRFMLASTLVGVLGGFAWSLAAGSLSWLGPVSGAALVLGALSFLGFVVRQLGDKGRASSWGRFILASAAWMVGWAGLDLALRVQAAATGPGVYSERARLVLMELAIFGFALNVIYGVGQKLLPGLLRGGSTRKGMFDAAWGVHNAGVLLVGLAHLADLERAAALGSITIAVGAGLYVAGLRGLFQARKPPPRPEAGPGVLVRYIQLAFFWLAAGLVLLVGGDLYVAATGELPPHAYIGAMRHALTVGFMTTLILGVGQRIVPILSRDLLAWPRLADPVFALIAVGNALRVGLELATLAWPVAFWILPISALFELTALSLFAANIFRTLWPAPEPLLAAGRVTPASRVAVLLAEHTWLEDHLVDWGIRYVGRVRAVPPVLTLGSMANGENFKPDDLVSRINALMAARQATAMEGRPAKPDGAPDQSPA